MFFGSERDDYFAIIRILFKKHELGVKEQVRRGGNAVKEYSADLLLSCFALDL